MSELQLELATVVQHKKKSCYWCGDTGTVQPEQGVTFGGYPCEECDANESKPKAAIDQPGIRLAKLLRQYDETPSSALWSEIQSVAREVLR